MSSQASNSSQVIDDILDASEKMQAVEAIANEHVLGQENVIRTSLAATIAGGHVLLEASPGLAKTRLVRVFAQAMGLNTGRIQFVPDTMPADILGMEMLKENDKGEQHLEFVPGPMMNQLLHADEINRASSRTQAALLQAMEEKMITIAGVTYILPEPFTVYATQNPNDDNPETSPLPTAQMDRFLVRLKPEDITNPKIRLDIMRMTTQGDQNAKIEEIKPVFEYVEMPVLVAGSGEKMPEHELRRIQRLAEHITVPVETEEYIERLTRTIRPNLRQGVPNPDAENYPYIRETFESGATGERGAQALVKLSRAWVMLDKNREPDDLVVTIKDVQAIAPSALTHRLAPASLSAKRSSQDGEAPKRPQEIVQQLAADLA